MFAQESVMENPEKIEIQGLETIHKLCKFGADHNMEGCTFTEIVERMFDELKQAQKSAVPEGFVIVPKEIPKSFDEGLYFYSNSISVVNEHSDGFIPMSDIDHSEIWKLVIEAQEPTND